MTYFCLREYAHIRRGDVSDAAFAWLETLANQRKSGEKEFLRHHGKSLQVRNFVGILETPDGTCIEILPKTADTASPENDRRLLWKMLHVVHDLPFHEATDAALEKHQGSLLEILVARFLQEVSRIVHRGIRSDYVRITAEAAFIKGRLRVAQQIRQPLSRQHRFQIEYDCFLPNRAENRLIKAALQYVTKSSRHLNNQRLARELLFAFDSIPSSHQVKADFSRWSTQRDMVYYRAAKPWVELILVRETPWFLQGKWQGISLLFPMEKLFERYVAARLRQKLKHPYSLVEQSSKHSLIDQHGTKALFQLKPDMCIREGKNTCLVLDAKWKRLDTNADKYGLSQADFYQLFAYGQKYLSGIGEMLLIYPKTEQFSQILSPFHFDQQLTVWVVPFCLETDALLLSGGKTNAQSFFYSWGDK
ncbi:McrC family protein [Thiothrix subterranea]|uniref:McrC family protein n=1 Tax=Thiothrix subterranea TaxID=2735563 RepID=A0AA51MLJ0_9GAMM|nr:McrC family protein [Thiothrix subterranea]MDQ5767994.1 McrC family protein [Thiothrix subterranea]WML85241.1 McrC family protein [Thiothrix subterranea]